MNTRSIIAGAVAATALLVAVPAASAATSTAPGKPGPSKHVTTAKKGWTLCASRTGKVRLATKLKPCSRWETKIPVAPVQQPKPQPKKDDRPAPYYLREGNTTKYCAPVGKWRGAWVVDCKVIAQKPQPSPEPTPTPTETTPEPSPTATATAESADS